MTMARSIAAVSCAASILSVASMAPAVASPALDEFRRVSISPPHEWPEDKSRAEAQRLVSEAWGKVCEPPAERPCQVASHYSVSVEFFFIPSREQGKLKQYYYCSIIITGPLGGVNSGYMEWSIFKCDNERHPYQLSGLDADMP